MKFAKWGNSLAIRIPAEVVAELGISENDEAEVRVTGSHSFEVARDRRREQAILAMRKLAVPLPEGYKFNRGELHDERFDRSVLGRAMRKAEADSASTASGADADNAQ